MTPYIKDFGPYHHKRFEHPHHHHHHRGGYEMEDRGIFANYGRMMPPSPYGGQFGRPPLFGRNFGLLLAGGGIGALAYGIGNSQGNTFGEKIRNIFSRLFGNAPAPEAQNEDQYA